MPRVRCVVLNYNAGADLLRCVESLVALDWPRDALEIVVVDNASSDGSVAPVVDAFPEVVVRRNLTNVGFSGNNLALCDLEGLDHVALVNPDATVEPGWLRALVRAAGPGIGAVCPTILLEDHVVTVEVPAPRPGDRVVRTVVDGVDTTPASLHHLRVTGRSVAPSGPLGSWSVAVATPDAAEPAWVEVTVAGSAGDAHGPDGDERVHRVLAPGAPSEVINNAGGCLGDDFYGRDRLLGSPDSALGADPTPVEVFSWSGGGVLLSVDYLRTVGLFDPVYFLYYEDLDLSWRGRSEGWRYVHAPSARMHHRLGASTGVGSPLFRRHNERGRLLAVCRNAPSGAVLAVMWRYVRSVLGHVREALRSPKSPDRFDEVRLRVGVLADLVRHARPVLASRRALAARRTVAHHEVLRLQG